MKLVYDINQKPPLKKNLVYAFQQLLAIMAATLLVPILADATGLYLNQPAALFGAGMGTLFYIFIATRKKSPVFLGSSFAFISPLASAVAYGFGGILLGSVFAGLVYVLIALIIKKTGSAWVNKLLPPVVIGPTVALIGLSLAVNAVNDAVGVKLNADGVRPMDGHAAICLLCALVTLAVVIICSVYGKKMTKMIPFILGILAGYAVAAIFTVIGIASGNEMLKIIDFTKFQHMQWYPDFSFLEAFKGNYNFGSVGSFGSYLAVLAVAYVPVAFVVFAEHKPFLHY